MFDMDILQFIPMKDAQICSFYTCCVILKQWFSAGGVSHFFPKMKMLVCFQSWNIIQLNHKTCKINIIKKILKSIIYLFCKKRSTVHRATTHSTKLCDPPVEMHWFIIQTFMSYTLLSRPLVVAHALSSVTTLYLCHMTSPLWKFGWSFSNCMIALELALFYFILFFSKMLDCFLFKLTLCINRQNWWLLAQCLSPEPCACPR